MRFLFLKKLINIILFTKFYFLSPKKSKILVFDQVSDDLLVKYFHEDQIHILHTRKERLNLYVIFFNFIKGKFTMLDYFQSYIDYVNPKIIITTIDNNPIFYRLGKNSTQKKIAVASTWRTTIHDDSIFTIENSKIKVVTGKDYNVDYIFVINDSIGKLFKKLNAKKVITIGSFKSNYYEIDNIIKDIEILFISSYSDAKPDSKVTNEINFANFDSYQIALLDNISKYIKKYNSNISILGKMPGKFANQEYEYYNSIFKNTNWNFIKSEVANSYKIVDKSKIVIVLNSTLGYESFSRGNKTIFFDIRSHLESLKTLQFGWPIENLQRNGPFWTTDASFEALEQIINNVKNMEDSRWKDLNKNYIKKIMPRDRNNSIFKSLLDKYI